MVVPASVTGGMVIPYLSYHKPHSLTDTFTGSLCMANTRPMHSPEPTAEQPYGLRRLLHAVLDS